MNTPKLYAVKLLSRKMYTIKQLRDALKKREYDEDVISEVIDELCAEKLLDDFKYAQMYIIDASNLRSKGMYRIKAELFERGIDKDIISDAFSESEVNETEALREYIKARACVAQLDLSDYKTAEKLKGHLYRKGYSIYDINKCIKELCSED